VSRTAPNRPSTPPPDALAPASSPARSPAWHRVWRRLCRPVGHELACRLARAAEDHRRRGRAPGEPDPLSVWHGPLESGFAIDSRGHADPAATDKLRAELTYWVRAARGEDPGLPGGLEVAFRAWQSTRLRELGERLGLPPEPGAFERWAAGTRAVEVGCGPIPSLALAHWRVAVGVDPLGDGYAAEGLVPTWADHVAMVPACGERLPLPSRSFDLGVCENALDHCEHPARVLGELRRVLRPGGRLWLLVDLMTHRDAMHPSPFADEHRVRASLRDAGFTVESLEAWAGASHPCAERQCRVLATRA